MLRDSSDCRIATTAGGDWASNCKTRQTRTATGAKRNFVMNQLFTRSTDHTPVRNPSLYEQAEIDGDGGVHVDCSRLYDAGGGFALFRQDCSAPRASAALHFWLRARIARPAGLIGPARS